MLAPLCFCTVAWVSLGITRVTKTSSVSDLADLKEKHFEDRIVANRYLFWANTAQPDKT